MLRFTVSRCVYVYTSISLSLARSLALALRARARARARVCVCVCVCVKDRFIISYFNFTFAYLGANPSFLRISLFSYFKNFFLVKNVS